MPVLDHPVHRSTIAPPLYGCNGLPRGPRSYLAPAGWSADGYMRMVQVEPTMSTECRYDLSLTDPRCTGCKWRGSGEDYSARVRNTKKEGV
jgi:hypothetical protein